MYLLIFWKTCIHFPVPTLVTRVRVSDSFLSLQVHRHSHHRYRDIYILKHDFFPQKPEFSFPKQLESKGLRMVRPSIPLRCGELEHVTAFAHRPSSLLVCSISHLSPEALTPLFITVLFLKGHLQFSLRAFSQLKCPRVFTL